MMGRLHTFDNILKQYQEEAQNEAKLSQVVKKLYGRCYKINHLVSKIENIIKNWKKHKTAY
jgi:hypothetical protein